MDYIISDTHFNHENIIHYASRPFSGVIAMNDVLIKNWNSVVTPSDTVYHLGDFGFGSPSALEAILKRLNGVKILVKGNHDRHTLATYRRIGFEDVYQRLHIGGLYYLSHRPEQRQKAPIHLHGHIHNKLIPDCPPWQRNMCVELIGYTPVEFPPYVQQNPD